MIINARGGMSEGTGIGIDAQRTDSKENRPVTTNSFGEPEDEYKHKAVPQQVRETRAWTWILIFLRVVGMKDRGREGVTLCSLRRAGSVESPLQSSKPYPPFYKHCYPAQAACSVLEGWDAGFMPAVALLPSPPSLGGFGPTNSAIQSSFVQSSYDMMAVVADIKDRAKEDARRHSRGASALSLIGTARKQVLHGRECEASGDFKGALAAFTKAASLAQLFMDSAEFKAETYPGKKGLLFKEFMDFQQHEGGDLKQRVESLGSKITEIERLSTSHSPPSSNGVDTSDSTDGVSRQVGGSIADRMRSLQDAGLAVGTTKRFSRELPQPPMTFPSTPPPPLSPLVNHVSVPPAQPSPSFSTTISSPLLPVPIPPSSASSVAPSPHALVNPSSFGPPSPASSTSSSPHLSGPGHFNTLSEFSQAFPSIDELDEMEGLGLKLPSVPTGTGSNQQDPPLPSKHPSPFRPFPALPVDPGPRPASTPLTPTVHTFISRPASPAQSRSPIPPVQHANGASPALKPKPSALALSSVPTGSSSLSSGGSSAGFGLTNMIEPKPLHELMYQPSIKVLLLDVRTREEFDKEHIKADAVVCLEPSVLLRENMSAHGVEDSLTVAPRDEWVLFCNREKFDRVVMYDASSTSFTGPLSALTRTIYENEFRRILKNVPMLLVGGLQRWREDLGESEVIKGSQRDREAERRRGWSPESQKFVANGDIVNGTGVGTSFGSPGKASVRPLPEEPRLGGPSRPRATTVGQSVSIPKLDDFVRPSPASPEINGLVGSPTAGAAIVRRPAPASRPGASAAPPSYNRNVPEVTPHASPSMMNSHSSIQYPSFARPLAVTNSGPSSFTPSNGAYVSPPPQASINPSPLSRRRSDYIDQSQEALSGLNSRPSIDYPDLSSKNILRPPPAVASSALERQDNRPRMIQHAPSFNGHAQGPKPPTIQSDYPVTYWPDVEIGTTGLKNLGNTCYMNATVQCLSATVPFARFFTDGRWKSAINMLNPLGTKGNLARAWADILHQMWHGEDPYLSPMQFRRSVCIHASQFQGSEQHDSQEFLSSLLDGLHEDLNRILNKPTVDSTPEREAELEKLPQQIASEQEWKIYRMRNDSLIVDFFQGQFRNRLECLTCHKTSTTYNTFMYLTLPVPSAKSTTKVSLYQCLDAFVKEEVMEKTDAWHCPNCNTLRRATKQLSLSRLPPVLLIHLKRFSFKGPFTDKIETFVDFPMKSLDLTNYMPPPLPPGVGKGQLNGGVVPSPDDPRSQIPPYRYDLYAVTNHSGSLSSGHYTAFIASRGGWLYCDDSRVQPADSKEVVGRLAYVLYYKRTKA